MDKITGIEELIEILQICPKLDEDKLKKHLSLSGNQFLWQKTGFLLSMFKGRLGISDEFLDICKQKAGKSYRYISSDIYNGKYDSNWQLVVSEKTFDYKQEVKDENI